MTSLGLLPRRGSSYRRLVVVAHPHVESTLSLFSSPHLASQLLVHHFSLPLSRLVMIPKRFLSVGLVAVCLALAAQPAQANWVDDAQAGGQRVFQAAFDTWTE